MFIVWCVCVCVNSMMYVFVACCVGRFYFQIQIYQVFLFYVSLVYSWQSLFLESTNYKYKYEYEFLSSLDYVVQDLRYFASNLKL